MITEINPLLPSAAEDHDHDHGHDHGHGHEELAHTSETDHSDHGAHAEGEAHVDSSLSEIGHSHSGGGFWEEYVYLLTDPAHILFEVTMSLAFDLLVVYLGYQLIVKRVIIPRLRREIHKEIDLEHNISHDSPMGEEKRVL